MWPLKTNPRVNAVPTTTSTAVKAEEPTKPAAAQAGAWVPKTARPMSAPRSQGPKPIAPEALESAIAQAAREGFSQRAVDELIRRSCQGVLVPATIDRLKTVLEAGDSMPPAARRTLRAFVTAAAGPTIANPKLPFGAWYHEGVGPLMTGGPSPKDLQQSTFGSSCFFLSSMGAISTVNPGLIESAITPMADGTYLVRLFDDQRQPRYLHLDAKTPTLVGSTGKERWVPLLEKAYAATLAEGYVTLDDGGRPAIAMRALTGGEAAEQVIDKRGDDLQLFQSMKAKFEGPPRSAMVADSDVEAPMLSGIVPNHAYVVTAVAVHDGVPSVAMQNPYGDSAPNQPFFGDGAFWLPIADFKKHFCDFAWLSP